MKAQINITEENEAKLLDLQNLYRLNDTKLNNKDVLINQVIGLAFDLVTSLDEDSLLKIVNLKKSW